MLLASSRVPKAEPEPETAETAARRAGPRRTPPSSWPARCGSTRWGWSSPPTSSTWSTRRRRRPARPGQGAAPEDRRGPRHRHAAGAHPRRPRPAAAHLRHQAVRRRGRARRGASGHGAGDRRGPAVAARRADHGAGLRPGRQVGPGRAAQPGRAQRRDGRRPRLGDHHAPGRGRPQPRRPPARPRGRQAPHRRGQAHPPGRRRGAHARRCSASARCSGCCRRCSTRACPSATWSGSSRRCRCAPRSPRTTSTLVEAARDRARPGDRRAPPRRRRPCT